MAGKSVFERVWPISVHLRHDLDPTLLQTDPELKPFLVPVGEHTKKWVVPQLFRVLWKGSCSAKGPMMTEFGWTIPLT